MISRYQSHNHHNYFELESGIEVKIVTMILVDNKEVPE